MSETSEVATDATTESTLDTTAIQAALDAEDYATVIAEVRKAFDEHPGEAVTNPVIEKWIGIRFRNLFLQEAMQDEGAVKNAQARWPLNKIDRRPDLQKVAERWFTDFDLEELDLELPETEVDQLTERTLVFCPGLLTGLLPVLAFQSVWPYIHERFGLRIVASDSHPGRSSVANMADLKNVIEKGIGVKTEKDAGFITEKDDPIPVEGDFVLMGYSKGGADIVTLLVNNPEYADRVKGIVGWAGAFGGSFAANDVLKQLQAIPDFGIPGKVDSSMAVIAAKMAPVINSNHITRRLNEYDVKGAMECLTTTFRDKFNEDNEDKLKEYGIPSFYFSGATSFFEVPYFQKMSTLQLDHIDQHNDMQLTQAQSRLPGNSTRLALFHANHWDMSYDGFPWYGTGGSQHLKHPFPRRVAIASIVQFLGELGILR